MAAARATGRLERDLRRRCRPQDDSGRMTTLGWLAGERRCLDTGSTRQQTPETSEEFRARGVHLPRVQPQPSE